MPETSPCKQEAFVWRHCLKEDDYSPDRNLAKCQGFRDAYYSCLSDWRVKEGVSDSQRDTFVAQCTGYTSRLQACMQANQFQLEQCRKEMDELSVCTAEHDPQVRQARQHELNITQTEGKKPWWRVW